LTALKSSHPMHVVAGVVIDAHDRVLIAQRPAGKHLAGSWEFPGGKLEAGESPKGGLARELAEEIGIAIEDPRPLMRVRHEYPYGEVLLDIWVIRRYQGEPSGLDGQALRWCRFDELAHAGLLPADRPIVRALALPERLSTAATSSYRIVMPAAARAVAEPAMLTGVWCVGAAQALAAATLSSAGAADFIMLGGEMVDAELADLCARIAQPVYAHDRGARSLEQSWALGASGLHSLTL
jgi:mutator protein MutT